MKRYGHLTVLFLLIFLVCATPNVQAAENAVSGNLSVAQPTKEQLLDKWYALNNEYPAFSQEPSVTAPYKAGALTQASLQTGVDYLNFLRYMAHLPSVRLDAAITETAQYGAVVLAANNVLTHYPDKPADMTDAFYNKGYAATTSSNISSGYGTLTAAIQGCMNDTSSLSNLSCVGHRRWLLNPPLYNVGFGYAQSTSGRTYITTKVFDYSGESFDYDYVSWPASGNCLNEVFGSYTPWSVSLNTQKYQTPRLSDVKVTLTRKADGKTWTFDSSMNDPYGADGYMTVDNNGYGISNCIIFRPADGIDTYKGVYTVDISGLYTRSGNATTLHYEVDFFGTGVEITQQPKTASVQSGKTATVTVKAEGSGLTYTWYVKKPGSSDYVKSVLTGSSYRVVMNNEQKNRALYCVVKDKYGNTAQTNVVYLRMKATIVDESATVSYAKNNAYASATVTARGDDLTYTWYVKDPGDTQYFKSSVATPTYKAKMTSVTSGRLAVCRVKDKYGNQVQSKAFVLRRKAAITSESATAAYAKEGAKVSVKVGASGDKLTYTWYYKNANATKYSKSSIKTATYTTTMSDAVHGRRVYCVVKDKYGKEAQSKTFILREAVSITTQPKSSSTAKGSIARATVKASGDGLSYTWYIKNAGQTSYSKSSVTKSTYSAVMNGNAKNRLVYCVVKDKYGKTVRSNTVQLKMK